MDVRETAESGYIPFFREFLNFYGPEENLIRSLLFVRKEGKTHLVDIVFARRSPQARCLSCARDGRPHEINLQEFLESCFPRTPQIHFPEGESSEGEGKFDRTLLQEIQEKMSGRSFYLKTYRSVTACLPGPCFYYTRALYEEIVRLSLACPDVFHILAAPYPEQRLEKEIPIPFVHIPNSSRWVCGRKWFTPLHIFVREYPKEPVRSIPCRDEIGHTRRTYSLNHQVPAELFSAMYRDDISLKSYDEFYEYRLAKQEGENILPWRGEEPLGTANSIIVGWKEIPSAFDLEKTIRWDTVVQLRFLYWTLQKNSITSSMPFREKVLQVGKRYFGYDPWREGHYRTDGQGISDRKDYLAEQQIFPPRVPLRVMDIEKIVSILLLPKLPFSAV